MNHHHSTFSEKHGFVNSIAQFLFLEFEHGLEGEKPVLLVRLGEALQLASAAHWGKITLFVHRFI